MYSRGGASNKKMQKYPRILDYLEVHHPKVYEIIDDLAMHGSLTPRRGGAITFLLPDDKYLAEIKKVMESATPEKATDMVSALILTGLYESPKDFGTKDDIANLSGNKLIVKSVTASKVLVEDGELSLDTKFKPFERQGTAKRGNMAVWYLKGSVKLDTPKASSRPARPGAKKPAEGGRYRGGDDADATTALSQKVREIEEQKRQCILQDRKSDSGVQCPMLSFVCRVLNSFKEHDKEMYKRARSLYIPDPFVMFYLLARNPDVFPYSAVWHAYKTSAEVGRQVDFMKSFCDEDLRDDKDKALVLSRDGQEALRAAHSERLQNIQMSKYTARELLKIYEDVDQTNRIGGVGPIYPEGLAELFRNKKGLHLLLDEAAFFLHCKHQDCQAPTAAERAANCARAMNDFHALYGDLAYDTKKIYLGNKDRFDASVDKDWVYHYVVPFMKSYALRVPCSSAEAMSGAVVGAGEEDPYDPTPSPPDAALHAQLEKYDNSESKLSDKTLRELRAYVAKHGPKLPPEVL